MKLFFLARHRNPYNVKLDKEEEYLAPSLIKLTKKIEKKS